MIESAGEGGKKRRSMVLIPASLAQISVGTAEKFLRSDMQPLILTQGQAQLTTRSHEPQ